MDTNKFFYRSISNMRRSKTIFTSENDLFINIYCKKKK